MTARWSLNNIGSKAEEGLGLMAPGSASAHMPIASTSREPYSLSPYDADAPLLLQPQHPNHYLQRAVSSSTASTATFSPGSMYHYSDASPLSEAIRTPRDNQTWFTSADLYVQDAQATFGPPGLDDAVPTAYLQPVKKAAQSTSAAGVQPQHWRPLARDLRISIPNEETALPPEVPNMIKNHPSYEEVEQQFLGDITPIVDDNAQHHLQPPYVGPSSGQMNMSGVLLDRRDLALLYEPSPPYYDMPAHPQSAPHFRTTFSPPRPYSGPRYAYGPAISPVNAHFQYSAPEPSPIPIPPAHRQHHYGMPGPSSYYPGRPRSAPASPDLSAGLEVLNRRRGSSVDSFPFPVPIAPAAASHQPYHQAGRRIAPAPRQRPKTSPARSNRPSTAPNKSPSSDNSSPRGRRPKGTTGFAFINFTSADRRTLMNGVAPSGSSKKRQLEEEEADHANTPKKMRPSTSAL